MPGGTWPYAYTGATGSAKAALLQVTEGELFKVLDLGSGKGGAARWLAKTYGCHVTCFNLGEKQNEFNKSKAVADGIGELIETHLGSFNGAAFCPGVRGDLRACSAFMQCHPVPRSIHSRRRYAIRAALTRLCPSSTLACFRACRWFSVWAHITL